MKRSELFIWFNSPPKVERGAFNHASQAWGAPVTYIFALPLREERKLLGWDDGEYGDARIVHLPEGVPIRSFVREIVRAAPDAHHVFAGFSGLVGECLAEYEVQAGANRAVVYSERPGSYGPLVRRIAKRLGMPVKQRLLRRRYEPAVLALLPLGLAGLDRFGKYGWPQAKMFEFMYCPDSSFSKSLMGAAEEEMGAHSSPRFLYVGRFSQFTKGTDTLIAAVDRLTPGGWSIDLVGGYGDLMQETIEWARRNPSVNYRGVWDPKELADRMPTYDVCIIPSRFDGWNVVINEALAAGLGVIATDQAVSDELVTVSGAGLVVRADSPDELTQAMQVVVSDPEIVRVWKRRALDYRERISPESVGDYLVSVLGHVFGYEPERPSVPWL